MRNCAGEKCGAKGDVDTIYLSVSQSDDRGNQNRSLRGCKMKGDGEKMRRHVPKKADHVEDSQDNIPFRVRRTDGSSHCTVQYDGSQKDYSAG
jgi:hypothetical protein